MNVMFHNKGMDMINISRILNSKKLMVVVPNDLRCPPPIVSYTYTTSFFRIYHKGGQNKNRERFLGGGSIEQRVVVRHLRHLGACLKFFGEILGPLGLILMQSGTI